MQVWLSTKISILIEWTKIDFERSIETVDINGNDFSVCTVNIGCHDNEASARCRIQNFELVKKKETVPQVAHFENCRHGTEIHRGWSLGFVASFGAHRHARLGPAERRRRHRPRFGQRRLRPKELGPPGERPRPPRILRRLQPGRVSRRPIDSGRRFRRVRPLFFTRVCLEYGHRQPKDKSWCCLSLLTVFVMHYSTKRYQYGIS